MECRWDIDLLQLSNQLPTELLEVIRHGTNEQYLLALTTTALDPRYTTVLLAHCEDLFAHICASLQDVTSVAVSIATLGRVVPFAPFLAPYATRLLQDVQYSLGQDGQQATDSLYLLGLFRLLSFHPRAFRKLARPSHLASHLGRSSRVVTYLIIRIQQICLDGADHWFEKTVQQYLGEDTPENPIDGLWDDRTIDYRFLSLWEEERYESAVKLFSDVRPARPYPPASPSRMIPLEDLHPATALLGGVLFPKASTPPESSMVRSTSVLYTETVKSNLETIARALKSQSPLLLSGLAGSGKSMLLRHMAKSLGKLEKMVTLHLNEQSDAKLLLGIYTTGDKPGSFIWKPGVLTTAVEEGRWVLIEDLDRAPNEVLGTLLPLIERGELFIPNRKDKVHATEGFRILATVRTAMNHKGEESKPLIHMLGSRHWNTVSIKVPFSEEQAQIAQSLFPNLEKLMPQFIAVYDRLTEARQQSVLVGQSKTGVARTTTPRDLLKWCQRVFLLLQGRSSFTSNDVDHIFLEAIDCFVGALPNDAVYTSLAAVIAEEMHIDPQRRDYLLLSREIPYKVSNEALSVGRYRLRKARQVKAAEASFSTNPHTIRMLERVAAAVTSREPLLLVGETGVGKTTAVQHLAKNLGRKLVPFNLSQQSEAGDLLGGFKPVNARTLVAPLKDEFDDLFTESFSTSKNKQFLDLLGKQMAKSSWKAVCKLWRQALSMVERQRSLSPPREGEAPSKKRKTDTKTAIDFARWDVFAARVETLERQLTNGDDAFAFTFVEGNIVKAVRNGDWILLDEINLASPDTLEAIVDLFDPESPSLMLTEAGNIERINGHPDFRVFAAMNPATDVGKKDLPPGIRSRFTELYVESPDKDLRSLQSIVSAYLRQESIADEAIALDVSVLYQNIVRLAEDNKLDDGAGQKPHFSLRTLTRTLAYAKNILQSCTPRRALYEGFQMSFLTFLDVESTYLVQPLIEQHLFGKRTNIQAELQRALRKPQDGRPYVQGYPDSKQGRYSNTKHWIRQGDQERQDQPHYIITPFVRNNLENLVRAASTRQFPVLIQGPTSSGKTSMIEYLAKRTGHRFTRINNHEHTDLQEYLGTYVSGADGRLQFQEGVLVKALREGHWIVLDELNLAPTDVLEALNRLLDDNRELLVPETQEVVRPHPDFMLFATQNPAGLYGGRKTLSRAFRNRFLELHFDDIPIDELEEILHRRTQLPKTWCKRIVSVYRELSVLRQENRLFEQKSFATLRDLFRWALRPNETIDQLAANGFMLLCERVRKPEERDALKAILEKVMSEKGPKVRVDEAALYSQESVEVQQYARHARAQGVVWTKAMRRLYVLVSRAIQNNEAVLLVGETGCGKTTVCQMLADALQTQLHAVNAHQNTETGDLIGSQRPVRDRGAIEMSLREKLLADSVLNQHKIKNGTSTEDLLIMYDESVGRLDKGQKSTYTNSPSHQGIQALRTRFKALFEWADGSLVHAMRNGEFFLLDEISLADDSVLERINSVLESQRTILLAEKGTLDSSITAAPGFQFFATMNPGGDYGKRELSPALRNRFTEIWVPALSDLEDVLQIIRAKLVQPAHPYAEAMVSFASWFKGRFDTSATSSISIRDTLAWVAFVNAFASGDLIAAVVHGAALVYIDTLGANPAGLMSMSSQGVAEERTACLKALAGLMDVDAAAVYGRDLEITQGANSFGIGPFNVSRQPGASSSAIKFTFDPPTTRSNAMRVLRALQLPKPVMLEGSPGVGKTALVTAVANAASIPLTRINLSDQTDLLDLFGSDAPVEGVQTGTFVWRDAPFLRAMKSGEWVLLDEMNLASQSVLEGLNACLDHRGEIFVPELGQTFSRHPNFRLFAAQNPHHQGGGRKGLPASFVNRFTVVYADSFQPDDLVIICRRMFPTMEVAKIEQATAFVSKLNDEVVHRRAFGSHGGPWEFNLRDVARWLTAASSSGGLLQAGTSRDFVDMMFKQRFRSLYDRSCVEEIFASVFDASLPASDLFENLSTLTVQFGLGFLPRDALTAAGQRSQLSKHIYRTTHLKALQSVLVCVQNSWPVLLTGPAGAGKTALIERLASVVGADVVTLPMNAETDALDLIGGYEQYDPHRKTSDISHKLDSVAVKLGKKGLSEGYGPQVANMLAALDLLDLEYSSAALSTLSEAIPVQAKHEVIPLLESLLHGTQVIDKARFEWVDGPLIEALQQGKWLVLDNANLCSASVLDRLNSLLEPDGALIVNEHSTPDGSPRILRPHPHFRIFLTTDPRFGELSRAMRNRAVELFLNPEVDDAQSLTDGLHTDSVVARFRLLKAAVKSSSETSDEMIAIAQDHLSLGDQELRSRFIRQLENGLFSRTWQHSPVSEQALIPFSDSQKTLSSLYEAISSYMQTPADFACVQTLYPLNNQPLVQRFTSSFSQALVLAAKLELSASLRSVIDTFTQLRQDRKQLERSTRSWKAISQTLRPSGLATSPLDMVETILRSISTWLQQNGLSASEMVDVKAALRPILTYCACLLATLTAEGLDLASTTAYMVVGRALCHIPTSEVLSAVSAQCKQAFPEFGSQSGFGRGQGFDGIWSVLKPDMPTTMSDLRAVLAFEDVVEQFDAATTTFTLQPAAIAELRAAFQQALNVDPTKGSDLENLAEKARLFIPTEEPQDESETRSTAPPHFASSFEYLCQQFAALSMETNILSPTDNTLLEVLAMRKTTMSINLTRGVTPEAPQRKLRLLGLSLPSPTDAYGASSQVDSLLPHLNTVPEILGGLTNVLEVSLRNLSLLEAETSVLGRMVASNAHLISTNTVSALDACLRDLLRITLESFSSNGRSHHLAEYSSQLLCALDASASGGAIQDVDRVDYRGHEKNHIQRQLWLLTKYSCSPPPHAAQDASKAWAIFASTCLELSIPEYPYDPVQRASIHQTIYLKAKSDLEHRLSVLRRFRETWTGEPESLRARLLNEDIIALGPAPAPVSICRPQSSKLVQLHTETQGLMQIVQSLQSAGLDHLPTETLDANAWDNLLIIRKRLSARQYRCYADLTTPVISFVDCLLISRRLALQNTSERESHAERPSLSRITPLAGAGLSEWLSDEFFLTVQGTCRSSDERLHWLSVMAIRSSAVSADTSTPQMRGAIDNTFGEFYATWRTELSRDQKMAAAKSSLYKYRGGDEAEEEATQEELAEVFPDYEGGVDAHSTITASTQSLASQLAKLYHKIYSPGSPDSQNVSELLSRWANKLTRSSSALQHDSFTTLLLGLGQLSKQLDTSSPATRHANIYKDPNLAQSRALVSLVNKVQARFKTIHDVWPDHATPMEVIRACEQVQDLGHAEPVARYLPSTEKLHNAVNEWQKVASSDYSASGLLEEITNLIVSWRQLELSTWAGMFESEDRQCAENAASWWFVAYETIIAATKEVVSRSEALDQFTKDLLETLGGFLSNCGLGEYAVRLDLLRDFECALAIHALDDATLKTVRGALSSLSSFYSRFEGIVAEQLAKKRAALEKDIKNVIQLASWKDRNIETLRQSAKSSHKKLFRIVRKYRQVLSEPVAPLVQTDFPYVKHEIEHRRDLSRPHLGDDQTESVEAPMISFQAWQKRSPGLSDPQATAKDIRERVASFQRNVTASAKVAEFLGELDEESNELRKATPGIATEGNKSLVQHLKTRKRRLLADVLRDVRLMGFQTNLSDDVLARQDSLHGILAKAAPLALHGNVVGVEVADQDFYRVLHTMPSVRANAVKHSEDLTPAEVARSKMLLESILQVSIEQRSSLSRHLISLTGLENTIAQLDGFASSKDVGIMSQDLQTPNGFDATVKTVRLMLSTCIQCVELQGQLAGKDYSTPLESLHSSAQEVTVIGNAIAQQKKMPHRLQDIESQALQDRYKVVIDTIGAQLPMYTRTYPELEPVLSQLSNWIKDGTSDSSEFSGTQAGQTFDSNSWTQELCSTVEKYCSTTVDIDQVSQDAQSKKSWLLAQQNNLDAAVRHFDLTSLSTRLTSLLGQLHTLRTSSNATLPQVAQVCHKLQPLLQAYRDAAEHLIIDLCALHATTNRMAHRLAVSFNLLATQGFCTPSEKSQTDEKQSDQVESGTGLGEGEGGEDISKDVGDDEDLGELAQEPSSKEKDEGLEAEKDAVDMADEDLEGEFDEDVGSASEDEGEGEEREDDGEMEEETGHVDDKDAGAVDEKTWNDENKAGDAEKEAEKQKGTKTDDVSAGADDAQEGAEDLSQDGQDDADAGAGPEEEKEYNEPEKADPHMQEEQTLDLPEDMNMDGDKPGLDEDEISDPGADFEEAMSDADVDEPEQGNADNIDAAMEDGDEEQAGEDNGEASAMDQEEEEEEEEEQQEQGEDANSDVAMMDNLDAQEQPDDGLVTADEGRGQEQDNKAEADGALSGAEQMENEADTDETSQQPGTGKGSDGFQQNDTSGQAEISNDTENSHPFKQLGDMLKEWYNQRRNIESARETDGPDTETRDQMDMDDPRFEHTEDGETELQAIGAANAEQSRALDDQNAIPLEQTEDEQETAEPLENSEEQEQDLSEHDDAEGADHTSHGADVSAQADRAIIGKPVEVDMDGLESEEDNPDVDDTDDMDDMDEQLTNTHLSREEQPTILPLEDARKIWSDHETRTRNQAVVLTEHLRLILHPTQATKMRGDFRTGKRLNIKKIVPYIASSYKRDKIWMRRSIPSKRSYQIMLAIDDSESMNESERKGLAFDTLALVAKSMSMLEVGELCIIGFGETVNVNHDFNMPFTSDAGAEVFRHFSFAQSKTDVRTLLEKSIELFREARLKASGSGSNLWQLQLIISDGLCEDHASIRQLVRQAHEEQILIVFIVVDASVAAAAAATAPVASSGAAGKGTKQSIMDLQRAEFKDGDVKMIKYLDTFPFRYYLIVKNVIDLPGVLAGALRQWFSEVVETG